MLTNRSVATIDGPEFIDIEPCNPLISQCTIKVLYLGKNRNGSYIDKNTAIQMANSLPGTPIVAAYRRDVEDFGDHGHVITIEDGEVKFACKTVPYGFVAPDARVWFQKFKDMDEFGNEEEREYMVTTGYLWTGQYPEVQKAVDDGQPQSMELDEDHLDGHWANDSKTGMDFFIINDAVFSKLCILGDDVEPCFEGASITGGVDDNFAQGAEFSHTLYNMIKQLRELVGINEGGMTVPETKEALEETEVVTDFVATNTETESTPEVEAKDFSEKKEDDDVPSEKDVEPEDKEDNSSESDDAPEKDDEDDKKDKLSESALEAEPVEIPTSATPVNFALEEENKELRAELEALREFKRSVENAEKDALIAKYHMLSDEDKADIVAHKEEYTLEQIDEKLALVYVRNNVDFSTVDGRKEEEAVDVDSILSFSLNDGKDAEVVSDIQAAFRSMDR